MMPFDQIYWNHYGVGSYAKRGEFEASDSHDVRFGVTASADSHSAFSFYGKRRSGICGFFDLFFHDPKFPYDSFNLNTVGAGGVFGTLAEDPVGVAGDGDIAGKCEESKGWINSGGLGGTCKLKREFATHIRSSFVYSWPGAVTYSSFNVNDMQKTGNGGNNIEEAYSGPGVITDNLLFQSQNRESCHNVSNTATVKDASNVFIGIHKDYPISLTTTKSYKGYYLVLKRKRFSYNEIKTHHYKQYETSGKPDYQRNGGMRTTDASMQIGSFIELDMTKTSAEWKERTIVPEDEWTDNVLEIRKSPLTSPFSTVRDFVRNKFPMAHPIMDDDEFDYGFPTGFTGPNNSGTTKTVTYLQNQDDASKGTKIGYNLRMIGEGNRSDKLDIEGLFRDRVPWEGLLVIPLDDKDTVVNNWFYSFTKAREEWIASYVAYINADNAFLDWMEGYDGNSFSSNLWQSANGTTPYDPWEEDAIPVNLTKRAEYNTVLNAYNDAYDAMDTAVKFWDTNYVKNNHNMTRAIYDRIVNPCYYTQDRLNHRLPDLRKAGDGGNIQRPAPTGKDHDGSVKVIDAVIHPTIVPRERDYTGSVYLKSITIKKNGTVLKAEDDTIGKFIELESADIYTDQSTKILATGSSGSKSITISNMYGNRTNIAHRYFDTSFEIKFDGVSSFQTKITAVDTAGNKITIADGLPSAITNAKFTLMIPRGSTNSDYTWGQYDLTEFDDDTYSTSNVKTTTNLHKYSSGGSLATIPDSAYNESDSDKLKARKHVIADSGLLGAAAAVNDLFLVTSNASANNTLNKLYNITSSGMEGGNTGKAVRHPFFSNELSESLHIRNDFFSWSYYRYLYFSSANGSAGHISSYVEGNNVSWDKYKWVNYWEYIHTSIGLETEALSEYAGSGFTGLRTSTHPGFVDDQDMFGNKITFSVKEFLYGGTDRASSAIWPCYENNLAAIVPEEFDRKFSTHASQWTKEYTEAYKNYKYSIRDGEFNILAGNTPNVSKILDRPWFSFCSFSSMPGMQSSIRNSLFYTTAQTWMQLAMTHRDFTGTDNAERKKPLKAFQDAKFNKILKHGSVLASYGYTADMLGFLTEDAGRLNSNWVDHEFTIYESDDIIQVGTNFEVNLHQAGTEFNDDTRDEFRGRIIDDNQLGDGRSNIKVDNYTLYVIAK